MELRGKRPPNFGRDAGATNTMPRLARLDGCGHLPLRDLDLVQAFFAIFSALVRMKA